MSQRISPIGPNDRGAMPVQRVERRKRTPEEHQPDDGHEVFDEELEREMRDRGTHRAIAPTPPPGCSISSDWVICWRAFKAESPIGNLIAFRRWRCR